MNPKYGILCLLLFFNLLTFSHATLVYSNYLLCSIFLHDYTTVCYGFLYWWTFRLFCEFSNKGPIEESWTYILVLWWNVWKWDCLVRGCVPPHVYQVFLKPSPDAPKSSLFLGCCTFSEFKEHCVKVWWKIIKILIWNRLILKIYMRRLYIFMTPVSYLWIWYAPYHFWGLPSCLSIIYIYIYINNIHRWIYMLYNLHIYLSDLCINSILCIIYISLI